MSKQFDPCKGLKIDAKKFLKAVKAGDHEACKRARAHRRDIAGATDQEVMKRFSLMMARHTIARELRFENWNALEANPPKQKTEPETMKALAATAAPTARYCQYETAHAVLFAWIDENGDEAERLHVLSDTTAGPMYKSREEAEYVAQRFTDWVRNRVAWGAELSTHVVERLIAHANRDRIPWRWTHSNA